MPARPGKIRRPARAARSRRWPRPMPPMTAAPAAIFSQVTSTARPRTGCKARPATAAAAAGKSIRSSRGGRGDFSLAAASVGGRRRESAVLHHLDESIAQNQWARCALPIPGTMQLSVQTRCKNTTESPDETKAGELPLVYDLIFPEGDVTDARPL